MNDSNEPIDTAMLPYEETRACDPASLPPFVRRWREYLETKWRMHDRMVRAGIPCDPPSKDMLRFRRLGG